MILAELSLVVVLLLLIIIILFENFNFKTLEEIECFT